MNIQARFLKALHIDSMWHVLLYTVLCTGFTMVVSVGVVYALLSNLPFLPHPIVAGILVAALLIPLLIAAPLSFVLLYMLRLVTATIDTVNAHVQDDPLTGVMTRGYFLASVRRQLTASSVLMIADADHFKAINDTHGHDVGDAALKAVAAGIAAGAGPAALVGRLGGEEFGIFLREDPGPRLAAITQSVLAAVRESGAVVEGRALAMTVSVGVALHDAHRTLEETLKAADVALYQAKHGGRNRAALHQPGRPMSRRTRSDKGALMSKAS